MSDVAATNPGVVRRPASSAAGCAPRRPPGTAPSLAKRVLGVIEVAAGHRGIYSPALVGPAIQNLIAALHSARDCARATRPDWTPWGGDTRNHDVYRVTEALVVAAHSVEVAQHQLRRVEAMARNNGLPLADGPGRGDGVDPLGIGNALAAARQRLGQARRNLAEARREALQLISDLRGH